MVDDLFCFKKGCVLAPLAMGHILIEDEVLLSFNILSHVQLGLFSTLSKSCDPILILSEDGLSKGLSQVLTNFLLYVL